LRQGSFGKKTALLLYCLKMAEGSKLVMRRMANKLPKKAMKMVTTKNPISSHKGKLKMVPALAIPFLKPKTST
jgi:hypothetical protein